MSWNWLKRFWNWLLGRKVEEEAPPLPPPPSVKHRALTEEDHEPDLASPMGEAVGVETRDDILSEITFEEEREHLVTPVGILEAELETVPVMVADLDGTLMGDPTSKYRREFLPDFIHRMRELKDSHRLVFVLNSGATYDRILQTLSSQPDPIWPDHLLLRESEIYHLVEPGQYVEHMPYNEQSRKLRSDAISAVKPFVDGWKQEWEKSVQIVKSQVQKYEIVIMLPDAEQALTLRDLIRKQIRLAKNVSVMNNRRVVAITSNIFNKKVVLEELIRHKNWMPQQVLAIGDDLNDLPILDGRLGMAACPANAVDQVQEAVKAVDGYVSQKTYGDGALDCLEWFVGKFEGYLQLQKSR